MEVRRCMRCMHELAADQKFCPECGRPYGSVNTESFALKPGTILDGKYLVGEMLGQGGFGITYIGFDLLLEQKVAIKEYFPMSTGMVSRENRSMVVWSTAMMGKTGTQKGFDSFLKEARKMAKLGGIPGVVGVKSVFIQNETAYIVMDFIEGETLLKKLQREGPMPFDTCLSLLTPIIQALAEVHEHGIIHRDISPDNIMVRPDGRLILLDLGAAKDLDIQGRDGNVQSSQMVAKQGFSPIEQYQRNASIGPWTDVYAMAATIYYCCTGILPPTAVDRIVDDTLTCQPLLTQAQFDVLAYCMSIRAENRPKNMTALLQMAVRPQSGQAEPPRAVPTPPQPVETVKAPPRPAAVQAAPAAPKPTYPTPTPPTPPQPAAPRPAPTAVKPAYQPPASPQPSQQKRSFPKWLILVTAVVVVIMLNLIIGARKPSTASTSVHVMAPTSYYNASYFWGQERYLRKDVYYISFLSSLKNAPSNAWDVSEAGDGSILAWMSGNNLYVASNGKIAPNPNASHMFGRFVNLKAINFGDNFDTSNVTNMANMFSGCRSLTNLDLSCFNTSKVTNMAYMFSGCSNLTSLNLTGFDTSNVTGMSCMFSRCGSLTSLDVGGFDTSNVTQMSCMFNNCSGLTSLNLSSFDTSNVTTMFGMFFGCSSLTSLDISGFKASRGTKTDLIFSGCNKLTDLQCSDSKILLEYKNC